VPTIPAADRQRQLCSTSGTRVATEKALDMALVRAALDGGTIDAIATQDSAR
jgi:hypothetical protein